LGADTTRNISFRINGLRVMEPLAFGIVFKPMHRARYRVIGSLSAMMQRMRARITRAKTRNQQATARVMLHRSNSIGTSCRTKFSNASNEWRDAFHPDGTIPAFRGVDSSRTGDSWQRNP
jgi:hypothetical protein